MIPLRDNIRSKSTPIVVYFLIILNSFIFLKEITAGTAEDLETFVHHWAVVPYQFFADPIDRAFTLVTAMFLHGNWLHILGNMIYLFIFGDNVEDRLGHIRFLSFYLSVGALANFGQAFAFSGSDIPLIGASGAIAGVLGAYFFYYPHARVMTLISIFIIYRIVEIPAFFFLGFWFILQAVNSAGSLGVKSSSEMSGGIAWLAHAGGFVAGMLASPIFAMRRSRFK